MRSHDANPDNAAALSRRGHRPRHDNPHSIYRLVRRVTKSTGTTEDQAAQLTAIAREHVNAVKNAEARRIIAHEERVAELKDLHGQLREAKRAGDEARVEGLRAQLRDILGPPREELFRTTRDRIAEVLTEDQEARVPRLFPEE